jgi:uncharacterized membrane protein YbhN (UPF0104 family)
MAFIEKPHHHKNAKAILGLIIVVLAVGILGLFMTYQDNIVASNSVQPFIVLAAIGLGLLAGLFFLANQGIFHKTVKAQSSHPSSKSSKKKKRSR